MSRWALGVGCLVASLIGAAGASAAAHGPRRHQVRIVGYDYTPETLTVTLGDTIAWENRDLVAHTITSDTTQWDSGDVDNKKSYTLVATERGRTAYHCEIHPAMKGILIVH